LSDWYRVCSLEQIPVGGKYPAFVEDDEVLVIRTEAGVYALEDRCSHQDFPLAHGTLTNGRIKCKAHGAEFDLNTGKALCAPAFAPVRTYEVEVRDGEIYVKL
jgi:3-phenylpropionate/trans-cinnamate dioxygenase ferredoxin subunit